MSLNTDKLNGLNMSPLPAPTGSGRDAEINSLLREVMQQHADPDAPEYNQCDTEPCNWCERAAKLIRPNEQAEAQPPRAKNV